MFESPEKNLKKDMSKESASHIEGPKKITPDMVDSFRKAANFQGTDEEAVEALGRQIRSGVKKETGS